jgi:flagellar basal-body rod modification protein FlgD
MSTTSTNTPVSGLFAASNNNSTTKDKSVNSDKEAFLKLLIAQTSQQDPMAPQDSNQYVQQLTQFSSLEQLMSLNQGIETLAVGQMSNNSQQAVNMVGQEIVAKGDRFNHTSGESQDISFQVNGKAENVVLTITDAAGNVVKKVELQPQEGVQTYRWNGRDDEGKSASTGSYSVTVEATAGEQVVPTDTYVKGKVTGVRFDKGYPELMIGDKRVSMNDVIEVK